jgi:hypothetical protein
MLNRKPSVLVAAAAFLLFHTEGAAKAARLQFHYLPAEVGGNTALKPSEAGGTGERAGWFGMARAPRWGQTPGAYAPPLANFAATVRHPYTGRTVIVPLSLPEGTPRVEHVWNRLVYNYGSYTVEIRFLPDGSFDVIYDSGLLRAP